MDIENFICDYLVIPDKTRNGFSLSLDFAKIDPIAARAKYEYSKELSFCIRRFIEREKIASAMLKSLIDKYDKKLSFDFALVFALYKKYLLINFMDKDCYKRLLDLIPQRWGSDWVAKAKLMYEYACKENFEAAREILKILNN